MQLRHSRLQLIVGALVVLFLATVLAAGADSTLFQSLLSPGGYRQIPTSGSDPILKRPIIVPIEKDCATGIPGVCAAGTQRCVGDSCSECVPITPPEEELCSDQLDNDCDATTDEQECIPPQCSDKRDNDGDRRYDFTRIRDPNGHTLDTDPDCSSATDNSETPACNDNKDNDRDGAIDLSDGGCRDIRDNNEINPACIDNIDNDSDGKIDYPADLGCNNTFDQLEENGICIDGIDNDGDTFVDYPADPGCDFRDDWDEINIVECADERDNDRDRFIDMRDRGCSSTMDPSEQSQCADGYDNDGDGLVDSRNDPGCTSAGDNTEQNPTCMDSLDNDRDGFVDLGDPICIDANQEEVAALCSNGRDDDADGEADYPADNGCTAFLDNDEKAACSDTIDNDLDGTTDTADADCTSPEDNSEQTLEACGDFDDNDADALIDEFDPGCSEPTDTSEVHTCTTSRDCACGYECSNQQCTYVPAQPTCELPGDANDDGTVTCEDVTCVMRVSVGNPDPVACPRQDCMDVHPRGELDNTIDVGDAVQVSRLALQFGYVCDDTPDSDGSPSGPLACIVANACNDSVDNDGDGAIDLRDPGCSTRGDTSERSTATCDDGVDNDGDGVNDFPGDPGCESIADRSEKSPAYACDDGLDNDGDTQLDFQILRNVPGRLRESRTPGDPGCMSPSDNSERASNITCDDGVDNDGDGLIDYPTDMGCIQPIYTDETNPPCNDGIDNDNDGSVDYKTDGSGDHGCTKLRDDEIDPNVQCDNGIDDDGNGRIDIADDGCYYTWDPEEATRACNDGRDNDQDGKIDLDDNGCKGTDNWLIIPDDNETSPSRYCDDGIDNDRDGKADYRLNSSGDPGCTSITDNSERGFADCDDNRDDDIDGLEDFPEDPGCTSPTDTDERGVVAGCDDGVDNDGDGETDYSTSSWLRDPGCESPYDRDEVGGGRTDCDDSVDNDRDGKADYPEDPGCLSYSDPLEKTGYACDDWIDLSFPPDGTPETWLDNDGDGLADYGNDPGCVDVMDPNEMGGTACDDSLDNDLDGYVDFDGNPPTATRDPDCSSAMDTTEESFYDRDPQCNNEMDDDGDGDEDFPEDFGCDGSSDDNEHGRSVCDDGIDNDHDNRVDTDDTGCSSSTDNSETSAVSDCMDGYDNDSDGFTDLNDPGCEGDEDFSEYSEIECDDGISNDYDNLDDVMDPGCEGPTDPSEYGSVACDNGIDDDYPADNLIDWPNDPECESPESGDEGYCYGDEGTGLHYEPEDGFLPFSRFAGLLLDPFNWLPQATADCAAPTCEDVYQNQSETDKNCGGPNCADCAIGQTCKGPTDCVSGVCFEGVCHTGNCDTSLAQAPARRILELNGDDIIRLSNSGNLPGNDSPIDNIVDISNSACPVVERYAPVSASGCDTGGRVRVEPIPSATTNFYLREYAPRTLNAIVEIGESMEDDTFDGYSGMYVSSLFGDNHHCSDHRRMGGFDVSKFVTDRGITVSVQSLHNARNSSELCDIAREIKEKLADNGLVEIRGPTYMKNDADCRNDTMMAGDSSHSDHFHVSWNPPAR